MYTLVIRTDNSFEIFIDQTSVKTGSLLADFDPPVNPPKQIDDPTDKKPDDWVDEKKIDDPEASKPEDWDEDAPMMIDDMDATKPTDWNDDAPVLTNRILKTYVAVSSRSSQTILCIDLVVNGS